MKKIIFITAILFSLFACNNAKKQQTFNEDDVVFIDSEDEAMNKAMADAKTTFSEFKKAFIENQTDDKYYSFSIKIGFPSPAYGKEHMWVGSLSLDGDTFTGILDNEPEDEGVAYKLGDPVVIDPALISDWMYTEKSNDITHGAYTIKVMRANLSPEEQEAFDNYTQMKFE